MTGALVRLILNGEKRDFPVATSVGGMVSSLQLPVRAGIAIAINDEVVPRSTWDTRVLMNDDRVLILAASQGG